MGEGIRFVKERHGAAPSIEEGGSPTELSVTDYCQVLSGDETNMRSEFWERWSILITSKNYSRIFNELGHREIQIRTIAVKYGQ